MSYMQQPPQEFQIASSDNNQASSATQDTTSSDWQEFTATDGRRYYCNKRTKQSSWEKPMELMTPPERADVSTVWKEFTTSEGKKYYYNKDTKQSNWTIPDELKLARELAEKKASRGTQSPATFKSSTFDQPSAFVSSANDVSSSTITKMSKKDTMVTSVGSKKVCGKTRNVKLSKLCENNGKRAMPVEFDQNTYRPVGDHADDFTTLGVKRKKVGEASGSGSVPVEDHVHVSGPEKQPQGKKKVKLLVSTEEARFMDPEGHPWLNWPNCTKNEKFVLNNKLAILQKRGICAPRSMEWPVFDELDIKAEIERRLLTKHECIEGELEIPIWSRVFKLRERVYREWCLEFYSSLRVDKTFKNHELRVKKLIHFRLGGQERHCTMEEFGLLTGMFTQAEVDHDEFSDYLVSGERDSSEFLKGINDYWYQISWREEHSSSSSKVADIRYPILRVLSKMLTYSFFHRTTQNDKVYAEDLWLLSFFNEGYPESYVNVPWVLACYMEKKAGGKKAESQLCCGHFVTRIAKGLHLDSEGNIRDCSPGVDTRFITMHDLETSKLLEASRTRLIAEGERPPQRVRPRKGDNQEVVDAVERQSELMAMLVSQNARLIYHLHRYQPYLEKFAEERAPGLGLTLPTYAPPDLFIPVQEQAGAPAGRQEEPKGEASDVLQAVPEDVGGDDV